MKKLIGALVGAAVIVAIIIWATQWSSFPETTEVVTGGDVVAIPSVSEDAKIYKLQEEESKVIWKGRRVAESGTVAGHEGVVQLLDGGIAIKGNNVQAGKFIIDMQSITATDLQGDIASQQKLEENLKTNFFETERFPTATVIVKKVQDSVVIADVTIKGITQQVAFPINIKYAGSVIAAKASILIDRTQWGIQQDLDTIDKLIQIDMHLIFAR